MALTGTFGGMGRGERRVVEDWDSDREKDLYDWWIDQATTEAGRTAAKAVEYGAYDLELIGQLMRESGVDAPGVSDIELGVWFYLFGKLGRAVSALREGRPPSDDTIFDINVYGRMIARIRETGGWPG